MKGHCIRAKVKWIDKREKPSKYFLTLESRNYINKQIPQLVRNDGITIYDHFEILKETKCYYENLYRKREQYLDTNDIIEQFSNDIKPMNILLAALTMLRIIDNGRPTIFHKNDICHDVSGR